MTRSWDHLIFVIKNSNTGFHYWDWNVLVCGLHFKAGLIKLPLKLGQRQVITFHKNLWDTISHQCPTLTLTVLLSLRSHGFRWLFPTQNPTLSDLYMNFHYGEKTILSTLPSIEIYHWYGQFHYNLISFLNNNRNRHPMAHLSGEVWGVFCEFEIWVTINLCMCFTAYSVMS